MGWLREEFEALGVPFDRRGARSDEYIAALRVLWTEEEAEFHGEFVDFDPVYCQPKPVQQPVPPSSARRTARFSLTMRMRKEEPMLLEWNDA
ncbi:LLM class flavin-dependent oxidoreductase [Candidatus Poriferisodalis sp.]|uniref:LLM class flavin-dependent oxidoreductase n=1 Tax=Candidatus Poriferisodalis sp. TaxID=3101277 RepID=UPI003B5AF919